MTRLIVIAVFGASFCSGCQSLFDRQATGPATPPPLKVSAVAPVQPADITAANARTKAQQLNEEMTRELYGENRP